MNWTLHNNSLYWKEECKPCKGKGYDNKGTIIGRCAKCNGEGHTYTKVEAEKPSNNPYHGSVWNRMGIAKRYNSQLSLIKELEEALTPKAPHIGSGLHYQQAQTLLSKYTLSEGKIKEKQ